MSGSDNGVDDSFWKNSPSPPPEYGVDTGEQEWEYSIESEEVDGGDKIRYEIDWNGWQRSDGTTETWDDVNPSLLRTWQRTKTRERSFMAKESLDIQLIDFSMNDIHNTRTRRRAQALDEKLEKARQNKVDLGKKMRELLQEKLASSEANLHPLPQRGSRRRRSSTSSQTLRASASSVAPSSSSASTMRSPRIPAQPPRKRNRAEDPEGGISRHDEALFLREDTSRSVRSRETPVIRPRDQLSFQWTRIAGKSGAAPIRFVNEIDEDELPPLVPNFKYLETGYIYTDGIEKPDASFQIGCRCVQCSSSARCECQSLSEYVNKKGYKGYAYTQSGLYSFTVPRYVEVIECNAKCRCGSDCVNRVAQRPRDVPLEIFKTPNRGWGARASIDIQRGKVIGMYTGRLIKRATAISLGPLIGGYCFDLDGQEVLDSEGDDITNRFSIDSSTCGNWTHFVNHSCTPNMRVYLVVYDTIPSTNCPYIAFVARESIEAGTELTIDYDPAATRSGKTNSSSTRDEHDETMKKCYCGSQKCREYVRMF